MKIVLAALNAKYVHSNLAVHVLNTYAKKKLSENYKTKTYVEKQNVNAIPELVVREYTINHNMDVILQSLYQEKAAVVAFSCYIWNISEVLTIAKELHKVSPETKIWLGGPEVSYNSKQILEKNIFLEGVICGEGELSFYELVKAWWELDVNNINANLLGEHQKLDDSYDLEQGFALYDNILGITYRGVNGKIKENPMRPLMSMDEVPFIYEDLSLFQNKILYYETSRGCPFSCSYCLSSINKNVRFRSLELVEKELEFFLGHKVPQVKFIDRTFNCNREHAIAIWKYLLEHDNGITNFHFEISADLLSKEELDLFCKMRPGLIQLEIGLQSTNSETIKEIRRSMHIKKLKENMLTIQAYGNIHQHLDLIAGLPYEDFYSFKKSFNEAYEMKPNQLQLGFLKVLKGSYMETQIEEYELQYQDFPPYEVLSTKWLCYDEILKLKLVEEMVEVYYNSDQFEHVLGYIIPLFESPYMFFEVLGEYYSSHELFGIGFKRESRYEVLKSFCEEWFAKSENSFNEKVMLSLLTYDYYLRENAKSRPSWCEVSLINKDKYNTFFKNGGTEEFNLKGEGYDSKVAARTMHLEQIAKDAVSWIVKDIEDIKVFGEECKEVYCLFDYQNRNILSKDAQVTLLSHL